MRATATPLLVLALVAGAAAIANAEDARAEIEAGDKAFVAAVARGDAAAIAALYTSTAQVLPPGGEAVSGREGIQKVFQGGIDAGMKNLTLTTLEIEVHGDTAHQVGTWAVKGPDGATADTGKYIVIWKNEGGKWRLHRDIWNSNTPPAAH